VEQEFSEVRREGCSRKFRSTGTGAESRWDLLGATICVVGGVVVTPPRN
jgi:hypothetical protein